jgi:hypothetical protein
MATLMRNGGIVAANMPEVVTPSMPDAIRRIADRGDRQLAWQFFVFFSRFEYALKRHPKYLKANKTVAEADWIRFANDHAVQFDPNGTPDLRAAVEYFKASPPRKQIQVGQKLGWSEPIKFDDKERLLAWLLRVVSTVRNNLFHGGKFPGFHISEPSRDRTLVCHAIVILDACLKFDATVRSQFLEGIEN